MKRISFRNTVIEKKLSRRIFILGAGKMVLVGLLIRQMRELQLQESEKYQLLAEENRIDIRIIPPARGIIFDQNGVTLAKNLENYQLRIIKEKAGEPAQILDRISTLINLRKEYFKYLQFVVITFAFLNVAHMRVARIMSQNGFTFQMINIPIHTS